MVPELRWVFKPITYSYEPPVTDVSEANKQYNQNVRLQTFDLHDHM
jgi:hypothetical protein